MRSRLGERNMKDGFGPVLKQSLSDRLARRIRGWIQRGEYTQGEWPGASGWDTRPFARP